MRALIISGGEFAPLPGKLSLERAYVIACDCGYLHARRLGIAPDLIVGDFDSAPVPDFGRVERFPARKDDTDTMLAVREALSRGCNEIVIACAFGGRLDHTFANIQAGAFAVEQGGIVHLIGRQEEAWIISGREMTFPRKDGWSLSVFSLSDTSVVTITGAEYECSQMVIRNTFPVGISNEWKQENAVIAAQRGIVMVLNSRIKM